jgi:hypothetical protein
MRLRHLGERMLPSLIAVLAGWAAALIVTLPMQIAKIAANSFGGPVVLLRSLAEGTLIWALWTLAVAAGGWLFGLIPVILLAPESWLLRYRRTSLVLAGLFAWIAILVEFQVWKLVLPYYTLGVRMFTLYSLLLVVYATVSAAVYLRLIAARAGKS